MFSRIYRPADGSSHVPSCAEERRTRAMTLIEVVMALAILALSLGGILAALLQSRRLTESSIAENSALTIVQGYVEQMKNMELSQLINADSNGNAQLTSSYSIPTLYDESHQDVLQTSTGTPPATSTLTPGVTPSGVVDNLKDFSISTSSQGGSVAWSSTWPHAQNYPTPSSSLPTSTAHTNDLHLNVWVWITDLSGTSTYAAKVYGITVIYTWQFVDGNRIRYMMGTVRTIRSAVLTL